MLEAKTILDPSISFEYKEIRYLLNDNVLTTEEKLRVRDEIRIESCSDDEVDFTITRNVSFVPAAIFDIKVSVRIIRKRAKDCTESLKEIVNVDYIQFYCGDFVGPVMAQISQIIASITMTTTQNPLITAPVFEA